MPFSFPQMPDRLTSTEQSILEYIAAHRDEFLCMTIGQLSTRWAFRRPPSPGLPAMWAARISGI